jgi:preprotein translocase subunit Sec63
MTLTRLQGQFFPYFILTISALVTLPLSYTLLRPNKGLSPCFLQLLVYDMERLTIQQT